MNIAKFTLSKGHNPGHLQYCMPFEGTKLGKVLEGASQVHLAQSIPHPVTIGGSQQQHWIGTEACGIIVVTVDL